MTQRKKLLLPQELTKYTFSHKSTELPKVLEHQRSLMVGKVSRRTGDLTTTETTGS